MSNLNSPVKDGSFEESVSPTDGQSNAIVVEPSEKYVSEPRIFVEETTSGHYPRSETSVTLGDAFMPDFESSSRPSEDLPQRVSNGGQIGDEAERQAQEEIEPSRMSKAIPASQSRRASSVRIREGVQPDGIRRTYTGSERFSSSGRISGSRRFSGARTLSGTRWPSEKDLLKQRIIFINNAERSNEKFTMAGNTVRTSKYSFLTFIPKNLFEQFHRIAYIYFLLIVILNQIPQLAVFGRTASLFPLILVLVVTAIKDGYEDWGRHRSDRKENNRTSLVLQDGEYQFKKWKHIRVGELVKVHANETVPCDMVVLATSDPSGVCYVETLNLDGESNLKSRYARQETADRISQDQPVNGFLVCELPNRNIYEFQGYMDLGSGQLSLAANNIVLRGCEVKNTSWIIGVVVYAGRETKAMLNSSGAQSKRSRLEEYMNRETGWLAVFLIIICIVGGLGMGIWVDANRDWLNIIPYYKKTDLSGNNYRFYGSWGEGIIGFLSCVIRFQIMIPLSLYISMELVRLGQSYFMTHDTEMYHEGSNSKFQCRALNINEDLGQIKYLFSDKTGTLTENKMEFDSASIGGVDYSKAKISVEPDAVKIEGSVRLEDTQVVQGESTGSSIIYRTLAECVQMCRY
jgi:phospholipid-transporting ATPase